MEDPNDALIQRFYAAFAARDGAAMAACYAPDATFSDPVFTDLKGEEPGARTGRGAAGLGPAGQGRGSEEGAGWPRRVHGGRRTGVASASWEAPRQHSSSPSSSTSSASSS